MNDVGEILYEGKSERLIFFEGMKRMINSEGRGGS